MSESSTASLRHRGGSTGPKSNDGYYYEEDEDILSDKSYLYRVDSPIQQYYDTSLNTVQWRVANLNVNPGDIGFVFWFSLSSYFPLVSGCIGPISNMMSIFALICTWKVPNNAQANQWQDAGADEHWVYIVNSFSVFFALVSNFFLLLNFRKKVRYVVSQILSVSGWFLASLTLAILIIIYHTHFYHTHMDDDFDLGYGFYFALVTVVLHFLNFVLLFLNELGFLLKKYKPVFNINNVQKSLIFQSLALAVWLLVGAAMARALFHTSIGFALYYCVISVVTIGEQQDVPSNSRAEGLMSVWIMVSLVVFGLIVSSVFDTIIDFSRATLYWHRISQLKKYKLRGGRNQTENNESAYNLMREVNDIADLTQKLYSLAVATAVFLMIFLLGALGFSIIEGWSYKLACYFCFCCLITLGCGNLVPVTIPGHVLFSAWALASIPSMTILISNLSGLIFSRLKKINDIDMYDFLYNLSRGHKRLQFLTRLFGAKEDTVDIHDLEKVMHQTDIEADIERLRITPDQVDAVEDELLEAVTGKSNSVDGAATRRNVQLSVETKSTSIYKTVPLPTHPADSLFEFIFNNNKLSDIDFVHSPQFVMLVTTATHLANYGREGSKVVNYNAAKVKRARKWLVKAFSTIDDDFNEYKFQRTYDLYDELEPSAADIDLNHIHKSVLRLPDCTIHTMFRKKNDYVLENLSILQIIFAELKKAVLLTCLNPKFKYTFKDWDRFMRLTENKDYVEDNENGEFWTGERSPLGYPNNEPEYFAIIYMRHFEARLHHFAEEYDQSKYSAPERTPTESVSTKSPTKGTPST